MLALHWSRFAKFQLTDSQPRQCKLFIKNKAPQPISPCDICYYKKWNKAFRQTNKHFPWALSQKCFHKIKILGWGIMKALGFILVSIRLLVFLLYTDILIDTQKQGTENKAMQIISNIMGNKEKPVFFSCSELVLALQLLFLQD